VSELPAVDAGVEPSTIASPAVPRFVLDGPVFEIPPMPSAAEILAPLVRAEPAPLPPPPPPPAPPAAVAPSAAALQLSLPSTSVLPVPAALDLDSIEMADDAPVAAKPHTARWWHTLIPRLLWVAGMLMAIGVAIGYVMSRGTENLDLEDESVRSILGLVVMGAGAMYVGAMWWAVAAAINARHRTPMAVSPLMAPVFHGVLPGVAAALVWKFVPTETLDKPATTSIIVWCGGIGLFVAHLMVIKGYRATAERVHGDREPWSYLLFGPLLMVGVALSLHGARTYIGGDQVMELSRYAAFGIGLAFLVGYVRAVWAASGSFDRACRRDLAAITKDQELAFGSRFVVGKQAG
jgi:hypothetical protein